MFAIIALIFGGKTVLDQISNSQWYLASLAFVMTFATLILGIINISFSVFNVGLSSLIILLLYLAGLRVIYSTKTEEKETNDEPVTISAKTAWSYFGLISLGVIISGYFLAFSVDNIAEISGIASSTLGIIAVSLVTTMPEASAYFASVKMKAADLGVAGLLGSCVFNISIIFYADIFYKGNLMSQFENAHIAAGIFTSVMILLAMFIILFKDKLEKLIINSLLFGLIVLYALGIFFVTS
jgi:cation:H+ antiporter|tara:strand:- start:33 stop:752 length:720 start_codon:yes stop_codon:yes gene_type:complete